MITIKLHPWTPKLLYLVLPSLAGATLWWYIVAQTLRGQVAFNLASLGAVIGFIVIGLLSLGLWMGTVGLLAFVQHNWLSLGALSLVASAPLLFWFPLQPWTWLGLGLLWLGLWWGLKRASADAQNRLTVRPQLLLGTALSVSVMAMIVVTSLMYYQQLRGTTKTASELSARLSDQTVSLVERFLPTFYKDYQPDQTVDELINAQFPSVDDIMKDLPAAVGADQIKKIEQRLSDKNLDPAQFNLDPTATTNQLRIALATQLEKQKADQIANVRQELSDQLKVPIRGDETVHQIVQDLISKNFDKYAANYVTIIPWLLAVALFLVLRIFNGLFVLVVTWCGWGIYRLLRLLHIVQITHQTVPAETLEWHSGEHHT